MSFSSVADLAAGVALLHLDQHLAGAWTGIVLGGGKEALDPVDALGHREVAAAEQEAERDQHRDTARRAAAPLAIVSLAMSSSSGDGPSSSWPSSARCDLLILNLDDLSRRQADIAFGVQHVLEDHHRGRLVDNRPTSAALATPLAQHRLR